MEFSDATMTHLRDRVSYPSIGAEILEGLDMMEGIPDSEREIFTERINPEKVYNTYDEVAVELQMAEVE